MGITKAGELALLAAGCVQLPCMRDRHNGVHRMRMRLHSGAHVQHLHAYLLESKIRVCVFAHCQGGNSVCACTCDLFASHQFYKTSQSWHTWL